MLTHLKQVLKTGYPLLSFVLAIVCQVAVLMLMGNWLKPEVTNRPSPLRIKLSKPVKQQKPTQTDLKANIVKKSTSEIPVETIPEPEPEVKKPEPALEPVKPRQSLPKKPTSLKPATKRKPEPKKTKKTLTARKPAKKPVNKLVKKLVKKPILPTDSAKTNQPPPARTPTPDKSLASAKKEMEKAKPDFSPWFKKVFFEIDRQKKYPSGARRRNIQGQVLVRFKINKIGRPANISIKNKPPKQLARAATELLQKIRLPRPPAEWNSEDFIEIPIIYKLR